MTEQRTIALWRREGLIVSVKPGHPWWASHAQTPTALPFSDTHWRVYFAARDGGNHAHIVAVDVDPSDNMRVVAEHLDPMLELGPPGTFDHAGMGPSAALIVDGQVRLYYTGVAVRRDVRSQLAIGVAVSDDGLCFRRVMPGPVLGTGPFDPISSSAPCVVWSGVGYRMWYNGNLGWRQSGGDLDPFYEVRTAESDDGLVWNPRTETAVALQPDQEAGLARPWVLPMGERLRIWFSRRSASFRGPGDGAYRIVSVLSDEAGRFGRDREMVAFENPPGPEDFDSWMQAYPCVVPHGDDLVLFYNGNDFGRAGFGWARLPNGARAAG